VHEVGVDRAPPGMPANAWTRPPTSTHSRAQDSASALGTVTSAASGRDPSAASTSAPGSSTASAPSSAARRRRASDRCRTATRAPAACNAHIPMTPSVPAPTTTAGSSGTTPKHRDRVETTRERFDRGRVVHREPLERDHMTLGHHDPLGESAVTIDPDVHVIGAPILQALRARGASTAPDVRLHADLGPVIEDASDLVTGNPRRRRSRSRQPSVGGADRGRPDANHDLPGRRLGLPHVERGDPPRTFDQHGPHQRSLPRDRPARRSGVASAQDGPRPCARLCRDVRPDDGAGRSRVERMTG
jgi:hypothetical protein